METSVPKLHTDFVTEIVGKKKPGKGLQFLKKEGILINRVKRVGKTHKLIQL